MDTDLCGASLSCTCGKEGLRPEYSAAKSQKRIKNRILENPTVKVSGRQKCSKIWV